MATQALQAGGKLDRDVIKRVLKGIRSLVAEHVP
jgi:hypothetical protein